MARIDEDAETRGDEPITFSQLIICDTDEGGCGGDWTHVFVTDLLDVEQMTDAPEDDVTCPTCNRTFHVVYDGWNEYGSA